MNIESVMIEDQAALPARLEVRPQAITLDAATAFIRNNIQSEKQAADMRQKLSDQLRSGGSDAEWRKLGVLLTRQQRREQSEVNRRIASTIRYDVAHLESVLSYLEQLKQS